MQFRTKTSSQSVEGVQFTLIEFQSLGVFSLRNPIFRPCFEIKMLDVTDEASGMPVLTVIDDLQDDETREFRLKIRMDDSLPAGAGSDGWVTFGAAPIEGLVFPGKGQRKIKVLFSLVDLLAKEIIVSKESIFSWTCHSNGYLESEMDETRAQAASLKLAMCLAAADGVVDDCEVAVIKNWGKKSVQVLPPPRSGVRMKSLNDALKDATEKIRAGQREQLEASAIRALRETGEARFLYDAYELCLNVLKADGEAHPEEIAQLTRTARSLGLDEAKIRMLTDRHLADVEFAVVGGGESDDDKILGITPDMTKDEIRRHLNKLFNKHRGRREHDDPKVREKAREWLEKISKARVRHIG